MIHGMSPRALKMCSRTSPTNSMTTTTATMGQKSHRRMERFCGALRADAVADVGEAEETVKRTKQLDERLTKCQPRDRLALLGVGARPHHAMRTL